MIPRPSLFVRLWILLALVFLPVAARAGTDAGLAAMKAGRYDRALAELSGPAGEKNTQAMFLKGWLLVFGDTESRDPSQGRKLLAAAAKDGSAEAQFYLGLIYGRGLGLAADGRRARELFAQSATAGYARARLALIRMGNKEEARASLDPIVRAANTAKSAFAAGRMYEEGTGVKQDLKKAQAFYEQAAEGGDPRAMHKLALLALSGEADGLRDPFTAVAWTREAMRVQQIDGNSGADEHMLKIKTAIDGDIAKLREKAEAGDPEALFSLGQIYEYGVGLDRDFKEAFRLYGLAAEKDSIGAAERLAVMHLFGRGAAQDDTQALTLFRKAAQAGFASAQYNLAKMLDEGRGTKRDTQAAKAWYERSADQNFAPAMLNLAVILLRPETEDTNKAFNLSLKAAELNFPDAQYLLSMLYLRGTGTARDLVKAYAWCRLAAMAGNGRAQKDQDTVAAMLNKHQKAIAEDMVSARNARKNT